jgi:hypothetical protein
MTKTLRFYVQAMVEVPVELPDDPEAAEEEQDRLIREHQTAIYANITLDQSVEGTLRVNDVECVGKVGTY